MAVQDCDMIEWFAGLAVFDLLVLVLSVHLAE
jgi:hypothetical protein